MIVIFANLTTLKERNNFKNLEKSIVDLALMVDRPLIFILSMKPDEYQKPSPSMLNFFRDKIIGEKGSINEEHSFYTGSLAGRPYIRRKTKRRDYNDSDLIFAKNCGIDYYTPE